MALERGTEEFELFGDYFKICKKHWQVESTDEYWENLIDDCNEFCEKYKDYKLAREIARAFCNAQEKNLKESRE
jgi:hypothetical protein